MIIEQDNRSNGVVGKGVYSFKCVGCGANEQTRVVVESVQDMRGNIIQTTKARICDPCSENGLSDVMMRVET
jgi:hypothetical protein